MHCIQTNRVHSKHLKLNVLVLVSCVWRDTLLATKNPVSLFWILKCLLCVEKVQIKDIANSYNYSLRLPLHCLLLDWIVEGQVIFSIYAIFVYVPNQKCLEIFVLIGFTYWALLRSQLLTILYAMNLMFKVTSSSIVYPFEAWLWAKDLCLFWSKCSR